jgi:hypothetical protein
MSTAVTFIGNARVKEAFSVTGDFAEMREVGSSDDRALTGLLSLGLGTALSSRVRETRMVSAQPIAYQLPSTTHRIEFIVGSHRNKIRHPITQPKEGCDSRDIPDVLIRKSLLS